MTIFEYIKEKGTIEEHMINWSLIEKDYIEVPEKIINFLNEITKIYKKYNLSLSHEDGNGSFIIENYYESNIIWLKNSLINVEGDNNVK